MAKNERYLAPPAGESPISVLLYGAMRAKDIKAYELEARLGISPKTLRKWLRTPEEAGMRNVATLAKILGVSKAHLCAAWRW